jgi:hypothetical protein
MDSGINVGPNEWGHWERYYRHQFPTASGEFIQAMCRRMIRTLSFCGIPKKMDPDDYLERCRQFKQSIRRLPPDPKNKLMGGK